MALSKNKKTEILDKVKKASSEATTLVFVNFHGLTVAGVNELRKQLRAAGVGYMVVKKTLLKLGLGDKFKGELPPLDGEIAIAYGTDYLAPAKGIYDFQKKNPEVVKIVGGVLDGAFVGGPAMMVVASIPGREVLYGQFLNVINSPIQGLVIALSEVAKQKEN